MAPSLQCLRRLERICGTRTLHEIVRDVLVMTWTVKSMGLPNMVAQDAHLQLCELIVNNGRLDEFC